MSQPSPEHIMQVGMGFEASKTLLSAVEVGLFTELAKSPADVSTLRDRLGLHPRGAQDFFDTLVALGFLRRIDGVYHNTDETDAYLDKGKPSYMHLGSLLEVANVSLYDVWGNFTEALRTGMPQDDSRSSELGTYDALYADPTRLKRFLASMTSISHRANCKIAEQLPWLNYKNLADMGTAQGDLVVQVLLANPHLIGTGFDLPTSAPVFEKYVEDNGLQDRLRFVEGDFFVDDFPEADVYTFGHILHNWDLDEKKMLLKKAWHALPKGGAVVVYDMLVDDDRSKNVFALLMSLTMLGVTDGGYTYTGADCMSWITEAGFGRTWTEHLVGPDSIVVGIK